MACKRLFYIICITIILNSYSSQVFSSVIKGNISSNYNYIMHDAWAEVPSKDTRSLKLPVPYVVVHHTYIPKACFTREECLKAMRSMQNYHNSLGWGDIGYNFCVGADGSVFEGRGWNLRGIHAGPANNHSIGICIIGDYRAELPPEKSMQSLKSLIKTGVVMGKIQEEYKLIGHQQASNTECPGSALMTEISTWEHFSPGNPDFKHLSTTESP